MAQGHWEGFFPNGTTTSQPTTGLIAYFLPLAPGSHKHWGSHTHDFWCCHGSLVQANAVHTEDIYFEELSGITICQYIPSELKYMRGESTIVIRQEIDHKAGSCNIVNKTNLDFMHKPMSLFIGFSVNCSSPAEFELKFRIPWWLKGAAKIYVNGELQSIKADPSSFSSIKRIWDNDTVNIEFPMELSVCPLPDDPRVVAFMEGPIVLAGLCDDDRILYGDTEHPGTILTPDNERQWSSWNISYRTKGQGRNIRFIPLYDVGYEKYSVYFLVKNP